MCRTPLPSINNLHSLPLEEFANRNIIMNFLHFRPNYYDGSLIIVFLLLLTVMMKFFTTPWKIPLRPFHDLRSRLIVLISQYHQRIPTSHFRGGTHLMWVLHVSLFAWHLYLMAWAYIICEVYIHRFNLESGWNKYLRIWNWLPYLRPRLGELVRALSQHVYVAIRHRLRSNSPGLSLWLGSYMPLYTHRSSRHILPTLFWRIVVVSWKFQK